MQRLSLKAWVLIGFSISVVGVFLNIYSATVISAQSRDVETEITAIKESLRVQAAEISIADIQNDLATLLHYVARVQSDDELAVETNAAAVEVMLSHLTRVYAAAHDIPMSEVVKADAQENISQMKYAGKIREAAKAEEAGDKERAEQLAKEAEALETAAQTMDTELGRQFEKLLSGLQIESGLAGKPIEEIKLDLLPAHKAVNDQFLKSFADKEARTKALETKKEQLAFWGNLLNYLGVSLQLLGMYCVMAKDIGSLPPQGV